MRFATTIPPAPRTCASWTRRPPAQVAPCDTAEAGRAALDWALDDRGGAESLDGRLASIEACKGLEPGSVRALRAERAPVECGDELAAPLLEKTRRQFQAQIAQMDAEIARKADVL